MGSTNSTTDMMMDLEPILVSSGLSGEHVYHASTRIIIMHCTTNDEIDNVLYTQLVKSQQL